MEEEEEEDQVDENMTAAGKRKGALADMFEGVLQEGKRDKKKDSKKKSRKWCDT